MVFNFIFQVKKVAVYVARANPKKTIDELMDALKVRTLWKCNTNSSF